MTNWPVRLPAVCMPGSQDDGKSAMPRPSAHHHPGALDGHGGAGRWMVKRVGQARGVHVMMKDGDFEGKCIFKCRYSWHSSFCTSTLGINWMLL